MIYLYLVCIFTQACSLKIIADAITVSIVKNANITSHERNVAKILTAVLKCILIQSTTYIVMGCFLYMFVYSLKYKTKKLFLK
jgi:hypothetical protein